jgi:hypothetical protein
MLRSTRALLVIWVVCSMTNPAVRVAAQAAAQTPPTAAKTTTPGSQRDAAVQFDAGVTAYKAGDFARAAEQFLVADGLAPSVTALSNALAAARRAGIPLLMARAAQRGLTRSEISQADKRSARSMLEEAEPKLARLELSCESPTCAPSIDDIAAAPGLNYTEPGLHSVSAAGAVSRELTCAAGQVCAVQLSPAPAVAPTPEQAAEASAAGPAAEPPSAPSPAQSREPARWKRRLPLAVFISAGVGALVFGGLATWQGVAALNEKKDIEANPDSGSWSNVERMARRSDAFMASGIVLAGVAAATAIWWVDWDAHSRSNLALLPEGGATLTMRRRF